MTTNASGLANKVGKQRYVADQQILNAVLAYRAAELEPGSSLSLEEFSPSPHVGRDFSTYVSGNDSLIWRWLEARGGGQFPVGFASAVVLINDWGQLAGGLVTGRWIKDRLGMPVVITGDLQPWLGNPAWSRLLNMCCTAAVPFRLRDIGAGLGIMVDVQSVRDSIVSGFSPLPKDGDYLSPFPLIGARVTSRCYWSQCAFCVQSNVHTNHFDRLDASCINSAMSGFTGGSAHPAGVQFLDYALPPALLKALAARKDGGVRWAGQVRFEAHLAGAADLFPRMANSGCVQLSYGFETGSEALLARMAKGGAIGTNERLEILRRSAEAGIRNHLFVITGLPSETEVDFASTLSFLERALYYIDSVEVNAYQMQAGTPNRGESWSF